MVKKTLTPKRQGAGLVLQTVTGRSGNSYIVMQTPGGGFHVFVETDAKKAALDCGSPYKATEKNTRQHWQTVLGKRE
jgi:hypothetical protein